MKISSAVTSVRERQIAGDEDNGAEFAESCGRRRARPGQKAGRSGRMTRAKIDSVVAAERAAPPPPAPDPSSSTGCTERTMKGSW
jgi:hypothetical protein